MKGRSVLGGRRGLRDPAPDEGFANGPALPPLDRPLGRDRLPFGLDRPPSPPPCGWLDRSPPPPSSAAGPLPHLPPFCGWTALLSPHCGWTPPSLSPCGWTATALLHRGTCPAAQGTALLPRRTALLRCGDRFLAQGDRPPAQRGPSSAWATALRISRHPARGLPPATDGRDCRPAPGASRRALCAGTDCRPARQDRRCLRPGPPCAWGWDRPPLGRPAPGTACAGTALPWTTLRCMPFAGPRIRACFHSPAANVVPSSLGR